MLTFKQIEALYWVVQLGSFSNAAARLHTTQSAITKRIQELESNFDITVFDRSGKKATLTQKGQDLFEHASELLRQRDKMLLRLQGSNTFSGTLRLGITEITAMTWLPALIQKLRETFPGLNVQPRVDMATALQNSLLQGQLDVAIIHADLRNPLLQSEPLQRLDFTWAGSPGMVSADTIYSPEDISRMHLVRQDPESGLNSIYDEWLHPYKSESNLFTINSLIAMVGLTVAGFGVACLPTEYFSDLFQQRHLIPMRTSKPLPAPLYSIMYHRQSNEMFYAEIAAIARSVCDYSRPFGNNLSA